MNQDEQIKALKETIQWFKKQIEPHDQWFKKQIEPHDCGWMYTTIDGLNHRIKFLKKEIKKNRSKETWITGYNKHKKGYDKWKEDRCPHN